MHEISREEVLACLPRREADTNKGSYGRVTAVAGSMAYRGAAALCCESALRTGAGLVYLASVEPVIQLVLTRTPNAVPCPAAPTPTAGCWRRMQRRCASGSAGLPPFCWPAPGWGRAPAGC